jgi:hypothetical protein
VARNINGNWNEAILPSFCDFVVGIWAFKVHHQAIGTLFIRHSWTPQFGTQAFTVLKNLKIKKKSFFLHKKNYSISPDSAV